MGQRAPANTALPASYVVEARDGSTPISGVKVYWTVTSGAGSLSIDSGVTDGAGRASALYTLGNVVGPQTVLARAPSLDSSDSTEVFTVTSLTGAGPFPLAAVDILPNYGIHDTFVRDGIAFVCAWNEGVLIYDVGNGIAGGSPSNPVRVSSIQTAGGQVHNAWWFHNPVTSQRKYLFVGQEGPGLVPSASSGDIHVVDVSDLTAPVEVATFRIPGAGTHNFWMDEANQILYAAYYNGGVVALDVSGTLSGNLASRELDRILPGATPFFWGVQLANNSVYATDMVGGLWQFTFANGSFALAGGGNNVPDRYTSDLWVHGGYAYTGTWNFRGATAGNALKVWQLDAGGAPVLVDSIITPNISTVSDVEVSDDGTLLMFGTEGGSSADRGFYLLQSDRPGPSCLYRPLHRVHRHSHESFATIGGRRYAFGAKDPGSPQLIVLDVTGL